MRPISRFTLEKHDGPYEKWPLRSRLFLDGQPTDITLPGYQLLDQFETPDGYILVTDYDCPFEEITNFALVSKRLRLQSCRWLGWMYETFLLERIEWLDERTFIAVIHGRGQWRFTVRPWGIPYIRPRLRLKWLGLAKPSGDGRQAEDWPNDTLNRKLANAFIPHATPSCLVPAAALSTIFRFKRKHGGLWVGGTVSVSRRGVSFSPNRLNQAFHDGLEPITVLASEIRAVRHQFGWFTGIVVVEHAHGEFRLRCYGAKQLAATIAASFNVPQQPAVPRQPGT